MVFPNSKLVVVVAAATVVLSSLFPTTVLAAEINGSQYGCDPSAYDSLTLYTNQNTAPCSGDAQTGCASSIWPDCDTRFTDASCRRCSAGYFLNIDDPFKRLCSINGGPSVPYPPYYTTQTLCDPCKTDSKLHCADKGVGTILEICSETGRTSDAQCVKCTTAPSPPPASTYLYPGSCDYVCSPGYFFQTVGGACLSCQEFACSVGQYRKGCNLTFSGVCVDCTALTDNMQFTGPGQTTPDSCPYECNVGFYKDSLTGSCISLLGASGASCNYVPGVYRNTTDNTCRNCSETAATTTMITYVVPGALCVWQCNYGYYRKNETHCLPCTDPSIQCKYGEYLSKTCSATSDTQCSPCNKFSTSMDQVAKYIPQKQYDGDFSMNSMCKWDCITGYYKNIYPENHPKYVASIVPRCMRCTQKSLNAIYVPTVNYTTDPSNQCQFVCSYNTYKVNLAYNGDQADLVNKAPCQPQFPTCPLVSATCPPGVDATIYDNITKCRKSPSESCEGTHYNVDQIIQYLGGVSTPSYVAMDLTSQGSSMFVAVNNAIYSYSTFQGVEYKGPGIYNGQGGALIAGSPGVDSGGCIDSSVSGLMARFPRVTFMRSMWDDSAILVVDSCGGASSIGHVRRISLDPSRDYDVNTLSPSSSGQCANNSFSSIASIDILKGTQKVMIVDTDCGSVHTLDMSTGKYLLTAGIFLANGNLPGRCINEARISYPSAGVWNGESQMIVVSASSQALFLITNPNTPSCMVQILRSIDFPYQPPLWSSSPSTFGGIIMLDSQNFLFAADWRISKYNLQTAKVVHLVGSYEDIFSGWHGSGSTGCNAKIGTDSVYSMTRTNADFNGGKFHFFFQHNHFFQTQNHH